MFDPLQSAYRDKHSTETALIKVQNDILSALDAGSSAILLMMDLSAAFDTIDHDILLSRLCNVYGITGDALDWFRSYLTGRIQRVVIENAVSGDLCELVVPYNNNNNCLKSNIQCIEIRVQWTVHLGSSHMHVHAVTRVHAVTPKLVICVMYLTSI